MIKNIDDLPDYEQQHIGRMFRYMDALEIDPRSYWIGRCDDDERIRGVPCVCFAGELDEKAETVAFLELPFAVAQPPLVTGLPHAVRYVAHLLSTDGALDGLRNLDVDAEDSQLLRQLGIDVNQACRPSVQAWAPGGFLAPDGDGFTYFLVEDRGELVRLAHGDTLALVAWAFAADAEMQRTDLSGRIGRIASAASLGTFR